MSAYLSATAVFDPSYSFANEEDEGDVLPSLLGSAYLNDPNESEMLIYALGEEEYLVPVNNFWNRDDLTKSQIHLDQIERVISRPGHTRMLSKIQRIREKNKLVQFKLFDALCDLLRPHRGYAVQIIL